MQALQMARDFRIAFGQPINQPVTGNCELMTMQLELIREEFNEAMSAAVLVLCEPDEPKLQEDLIKELTDLKYVVDQLCACFGYDIDVAYSRVHRSNMSKVGPNGEVKRRDDGKILKPDTYIAPDMGGLVVNCEALCDV